jgi:hypothetical protein
VFPIRSYYRAILPVLWRDPYRQSERNRAKVRAVIELKKTFSVTGVTNDAKKSKNISRRTPHATTGYLLAYSEDYGINRRNS